MKYFKKINFIWLLFVHLCNGQICILTSLNNSDNIANIHKELAKRTLVPIITNGYVTFNCPNVMSIRREIDEIIRRIKIVKSRTDIPPVFATICNNALKEEAFPGMQKICQKSTEWKMVYEVISNKQSFIPNYFCGAFSIYYDGGCEVFYISEVFNSDYNMDYIEFAHKPLLTYFGSDAKSAKYFDDKAIYSHSEQKCFYYIENSIKTINKAISDFIRKKPVKKNITKIIFHGHTTRDMCVNCAATLRAHIAQLSNANGMFHKIIECVTRNNNSVCPEFFCIITSSIKYGNCYSQLTEVQSPQQNKVNVYRFSEDEFELQYEEAKGIRNPAQ